MNLHLRHPLKPILNTSRGMVLALPPNIVDDPRQIPLSERYHAIARLPRERTHAAAPSPHADPPMPSNPTSTPHTPPPAAAAATKLIPFVHVSSVDASLAFYALLGFRAEKIMKDPHRVAFWSLTRSNSAELMLARASGPIDADAQAVLFYMYTPDVASLHRHLIDHGVRNGGPYSGAKSPTDGPSMLFAIAHPAHMPAGELRIHDPDGYVILVGQLPHETASQTA